MAVLSADHHHSHHILYSSAFRQMGEPAGGKSLFLCPVHGEQRAAGRFSSYHSCELWPGAPAGDAAREEQIREASAGIFPDRMRGAPCDHQGFFLCRRHRRPHFLGTARSHRHFLLYDSDHRLPGGCVCRENAGRENMARRKPTVPEPQSPAKSFAGVRFFIRNAAQIAANSRGGIAD